jgi:hypothetical protein
MANQPWSPADATKMINRIGAATNLTLSWTTHVKERLSERDLVAGDVMFVLRRGFVHSPAEASTQPDLFKYAIEARSPNSGSRFLRVIAIPDEMRNWIKIVTVMWVDE